MMNVVNFSDGVDGLAAGVCAISAAAFAIIAFDLDRSHAAILAACTAGAAAGFLVHNFPPASIYMGDCGANLLGFLLGCIAVEGAVKTQAVLALVIPLVVLAVPFLDTTFVVLKRMKYKRKVYIADANHFHHRFNRIGFSERKTLIYLYAWTLLLGAFAVSLRFIPYSDNHGHLNTGWSLVVARVRAGRRRRVGVPGLRAGDPQAAPPLRDPDPPRAGPTPSSTRSTPTSSARWRRASSRP